MQTTIESTDQGFRINGDLDFSTVNSLIAKGDAQINKLALGVIEINLESVNRIDSAGIALLLGWKRNCVKVNKNCYFQNIPLQAERLIDTYHLKDLL